MAETVTVETAQGTLRGREAATKDGGTYYSFQGVPFAKPPLGPLRFKAPEPPEPWDGVRDALTEGEKCTQRNFFTTEFEGSEDCLYLNVYTPQLPVGNGADTLLPVMFSIHCGGFTGGSGNVELHGPDYFMMEDVVMVSPTYRVGILGFLCLDGPACPGNMGLKDQVAALHWVQQNIAKFGGDPNNVTIAGVSAGGASVHYLMLSPMSEGLFHRAISSSGTVLNPWAHTRQPREMAFQVGAALGCTSDSPEDLVEFLRTVDHKELVKAGHEHGALEKNKECIFPFIFTPTLEVEVPGMERFLPAHPLQLLQEGRFHAVPCITGVTSEEAVMMITMMKLQDPEVQEKLNNTFDKGILPNLRLPLDCSNCDEVMSKIKQYFMEGKPLCDETIPGFIHLLSDILFNEGVSLAVKLMAQHATAPLYQYCFSFGGPIKLVYPQELDLSSDMPGVPHGADLAYLYETQYFKVDMKPGSSEAVAQACLFKIYTDFAKTGNPTPEKSFLIPIIWESHTPTNPCYLDIDEKISLKKNFLEERMAFWEELYKSART